MVEVESGADVAAGQQELWRQVAAVVLWERRGVRGEGVGGGVSPSRAERTALMLLIFC